MHNCFTYLVALKGADKSHMIYCALFTMHSPAKPRAQPAAQQGNARGQVVFSASFGSFTFLQVTTGHLMYYRLLQVTTFTTGYQLLVASFYSLLTSFQLLVTSYYLVFSQAYSTDFSKMKTQWKCSTQPPLVDMQYQENDWTKSTASSSGHVIPVKWLGRRHNLLQWTCSTREMAGPRGEPPLVDMQYKGNGWTEGTASSSGPVVPGK